MRIEAGSASLFTDTAPMPADVSSFAQSRVQLIERLPTVALDLLYWRALYASDVGNMRYGAEGTGSI